MDVIIMKGYVLGLLGICVVMNVIVIQGQTAVYNSLRREGEWLQSAVPPGPIRLQDCEASRKDCT